MQVFEINWKKIEFDIWEELTVKELRKIAPYMQVQQGQEVETIYQIGSKLAVNEEEAKATIDSFTIEEFEKFGEFIGWLIDVKKKTIVS